VAEVPEGRMFRVQLGPGVAVLRSFDATRRERTEERFREATRKAVDLAAALGEDYRAETGRGTIVEWSRRSRARMTKAFASVDWMSISRCYCGESMDAEVHTEGRCSIGQALPLAMVTLTYPGDWLAVCPTGADAKRHLRAFRKRWARALGWPCHGAWKEEFQRPRPQGGSQGQRAPHFHLLVPVPVHVDSLGYDQGLGYVETFNAWLSRVWADVVGATGEERERHEDAGTGVDFSSTAKMSDVKRCAVYFLKHGTKSHDDKEYQHIVPLAWQEPGKGPGRFWGFWGLKDATVPLDLDLDDWITARRVLRKVNRARERKVAYQRNGSEARGWDGRFLPLGRHLWTLGVGGQLSGGWIVVNDGVRLAAELARAVRLRRDVVADGEVWY